jgi:Cof subfamily protein (haloacid dehalogenase superfamily)
MTIAKIRAVALDLDGTLAGADHKVSARSARTLEALQRKGIAPLIVTGRTETAAIAVSKASHLIAPVVSCNGAVVTDPCSGKRFMFSTLDSGTIDRVLAFAAEHRFEVVLWTPTEMFAAAPSGRTSLLEAINEQPVVITPFDTVDRNDIVKIMIGGSREQLDAVQDQLSVMLPLVKRSLDIFYETSNPGASKWEALSFVLDRLGISPQECMGIADGDTDIDWLTKIGVPVAVENARPAVRAIASILIGHHANDAVAEFLERYFALPCPCFGR